MRIGAFDIEFSFREHLSYAEVLSGKAVLLHALHLRNVRGSNSDWLKLFAVFGKTRTKQKAVRNLPVRDDAVASALEIELLKDLTVPETLTPGKHQGELHVLYNGGEKCFSFPLEILSPSWIPTDYAHAAFLASWVPVCSDTLRGFAADVLGPSGGDSPFPCIKQLYEALLERRLMYQPVASTIHPDFQFVSGPDYVLNKGGSCADLSLLLASLLWHRGYAPALLLYEDHMTAGCFSGPLADISGLLEDPVAILRLIVEQKLCLIEVTDLCSHKGTSFDESRQNAYKTLQAVSSGCCLIAPQILLRSGTARMFPESYHVQPLVCPRCGYDHIEPQESSNKIICPACNSSFSPPPAASKVTVEERLPEDPSTDPMAVSYGQTKHGFGIVRCLRPDASFVRVKAGSQGKTVLSIGEKAFRNCALTGIILPEDLTAIEDLAFRGCKHLTFLTLPPDLAFIGFGAFSDSGLTSVQIPGSVSRVSSNAFSNCDDLERVVLEEGILNIDKGAFLHCPKLCQVCIPASVQTISRDAFDRGCQIFFLGDHTRQI